MIFLSGKLFAQEDTLTKFIEKNSIAIDTLKLRVKEVVISGNEITKDDIILREMSLKRDSLFTLAKYTKDLKNIYNLGLFARVDILPVPVKDKQILLNVDVNERWYILPLPTGGVDDGEYWKKLWLAMNLRWDNFRGRNESLSFYGRVFYNPSISFSYSVPWIGEKLHLFSSYSIGYSKSRNQSLLAVGRENEGAALQYNDNNYDNFEFNTSFTLGKYLSHDLSVFTQVGFDYLRVSQYAPGRTINSSGKDKYMTVGVGATFDSRDIREYATKGYYVSTSYSRYGQIENTINFGRFSFEGQSFLPFYITKRYYVTVASRVFSSLAIGHEIPVYNHEFLGYSENYVRGWRGIAYEGEDMLTLFDELRIPILSPRYIKARDIAIIRDIPIVKNFDLRHGLYFTIIYDVGTVFDHDDKIHDRKFQSGTGIGLDFIAPLGYMIRGEWDFRLGKPIVGQVALSLSAKF